MYRDIAAIEEQVKPLLSIEVMGRYILGQSIRRCRSWSFATYMDIAVLEERVKQWLSIEVKGHKISVIHTDASNWAGAGESKTSALKCLRYIQKLYAVSIQQLCAMYSEGVKA